MPSFRERPEYIAWKEAVFRRFGRRCVLCGHSGNIHAHHVKPVKEFPEKAFDVDNGVPLCGNCHAEVNGREAEYEAYFVARQRELDGKLIEEKEKKEGRQAWEAGMRRLRDGNRPG